MKKEHKHLTYEDRLVIELFIREKFPLEKIADNLEVNKSTIYREIKARRTKLNNSKITCEETNKYPFVCSHCIKKNVCKKERFLYNAKNAQINYQSILKSSRQGIDATFDELEYLDQLLYEKLAIKNQSIYHIVKTTQNNIGFSLSTLYRYINNGYLKSVDNGHLLRKLIFKPRKEKSTEIEYITNFKVKYGRMYQDYLDYMKENKNASVVQMDIVIGKASDTKCILTLLFTDSKLMLMFLIKKHSTLEIKKVFNKIKRRIGEQNFKTLFEVILTDNGWEFSKPNEIEFSEQTGEKLVSLFYCNPYSSWQKGKLERNHEFIRYVIPIGITFDDLNQQKVDLMTNNINNTIRKSLENQTPYILFRNKYNTNICNQLNIKYIKPENVDLSYKIIK